MNVSLCLNLPSTNFMYYLYVLKKGNSQELYYGYTNNLERRLSEHNDKRNWKLIYYETYLSELDARNREMKLKDYGQSRMHLKKRLKESLKL